MIKPASRNRLRAAIHAAGLLYAFGLAALLIDNHFLRQASPFVALASTFNLYLFMAALPLAVGLLLLRTRTALATLALLAALFLWANPVLPPVAAFLPAKTSGATVTTMTFNLGWAGRFPTTCAWAGCVSLAHWCASTTSSTRPTCGRLRPR